MRLAQYVVFAALVWIANSHAAPDEERLGSAENYPVGTQDNWFFDERVRVGSFSQFDAIFPSRMVAKPPRAFPLPRSEKAPSIRYTYAGSSYSVEEFLQRQRITGFLIIKNGEILVERYQYGRLPDHKFLSFSMAKSITSLAVGVALDEGKINSLDDKIGKYIPELAGYPYGEVSIRNVLRMSSGVKFDETYRPDDDLARLISIWKKSDLVSALKAFQQKSGTAGERFDYATSNTYLLGLLVAKATGKSLSDYVAEKIWQPMGAESDARYGIEQDGNEYAGSRFMAVLRDYGRLGLMLANGGRLNGKQIISRAYLHEATDASSHPDAFAPGKATPLFGYGYQFWLLPKAQFLLSGVHGQAIYVDPETNTVMVHTGVARNANIYVGDTMGPESLALWNSLVRSHLEENETRQVLLPVEVATLVEEARDAFLRSDKAAYAALYHPDYLHSGRTKEAQVQFIVNQAMGRLKQWDMRIRKFRQNGNIAHIEGVIATEVAEYPLDLELIQENGRWYFYGNRR